MKIAYMIKSRKRGSAILMVLAILSVLVLLGVIFTFVTRAEGQATANYAELAQARAAAVSGLPDVVGMIASAGPVTTTLQPWYAAPAALHKVANGSNGSSSLSSQEIGALRSAQFATGQTPDGNVLGAPMALMQVRDLSGRVNLNVIESESDLAALIETVLPGSDAAQKARAIMLIRDHGEPVKKSTEEDIVTARLDPRKGASGGIRSLGALRASTDNKQSGRIFSEDELKKLAGFVTVFSQAPEAFVGPDGQTVGRLPADQITADQVYRVLKALYEDAPDALLMQYALNLQDFVDVDGIPSTAVIGQTAPGTPGANTLLGMEKGVPVISEVYSDSYTGPVHGDDAQFIEIHNPWPENLDITGYSLTIAGGTRIALSGALPGGGHLVITDNYNTTIQDAPPGAGSLVSVFGATENGADKRVLVNTGMEIPDADSSVELHDAKGNLLDTFAYGRLAQMDSKLSFQRVNPFLKSVQVADATPFDPPAGGALVGNGDMNLAHAAWERGNRGVLGRVSDVLLISTTHANTTATATAPGSPSMQYPDLRVVERTEETEQAAISNLDLRLLEAFTDLTSDTPETLERDKSLAINQPQETTGVVEQKYRLVRGNLVPADSPVDAVTTSTPVLYSYGKINVNTCPAVVLATITGKAGVGWKMSDMAPRFEAHRMEKLSQNKAPFASAAELVNYFAPALQRSQLSVVDELLKQATVGSSAFEVVSENRVPPDPNGKARNGGKQEARRASVARASWQISTDTAPYEVLNFTIVP